MPAGRSEVMVSIPLEAEEFARSGLDILVRLFPELRILAVKM